MALFRRATALTLAGIIASMPVSPALAAQKADDVTVRLLVKSPHCTDLKIFSDKKGHENIAIAVPVTLNGKRYWFQLDTGTPRTSLYGVKLANKLGDKHMTNKRVRAHDLRLAGQDLGSRLLYRLKGRTDYTLSGTLGLNLLMGYAVVLDFPNQHFCLFKPHDLKTKIQRMRSSKTKKAAGSLSHGHLVFDVRLNGKKYDNIMYDSGTSISAVMLLKKEWQKLTGRSGQKDAIDIVHGSSWGKPIAIVFAPMKGTLSLGNMTFKNPMLNYSTKKFFEGTRYNGILGNALFMKDTLVLWLIADPRLLVIKHPDKPRAAAKP